MARRTKAQIAQDLYCDEVDQYKYFILCDGDIVTGYQYQSDAEDLLLDYEEGEARIVTKRSDKYNWKELIELAQFNWKNI